MIFNKPLFLIIITYENNNNFNNDIQVSKC